MDQLMFEEHKEWTAREFGGQPMWHGVMGAVEELGELIDAKARDDDRLMADAVADASLFLIGSMNAANLTFGTWHPSRLRNVRRDELIDILTSQLGILARCVLKMDQQRLFGVEPRYKDRDWNKELLDAYGRVFNILCSLAEACGYDYPGLIRDTWNEVKQRTKHA